MLKSFLVDALLFDLDGVLVDSTAAVEHVWRAWAMSKSFDEGAIEQIVTGSHGRRVVDVVASLVPSDSVEREIAAIQAMERRALDSLVEIEGAGKLLARLPRGQWAIVTSGARVVAEARLRAVSLPIPDVLIAADDVRRGKPDPEPFARAIERLDIDPAQCLVFEDAPAGIVSAKAAGAGVVALATTHRHAALQNADAVVSTLAQVAAEGIDGRIAVRVDLEH